jgi:hypothetical protein
MPIRQVGDQWYWGSKGPFGSREKAEQVERAAYASGYRGGGLDRLTRKSTPKRRQRAR